MRLDRSFGGFGFTGNIPPRFAAAIFYMRRFLVGDTTGMPFVSISQDIDLGGVEHFSPSFFPRDDNFVIDLRASPTGWGERPIVVGDYGAHEAAGGDFQDALSAEARSSGQNVYTNFPLVFDHGFIAFRSPARIELKPGVLNLLGNTHFVLRADPDDRDIIPRDTINSIFSELTPSEPVLRFQLVGVSVTPKRPAVCGGGAGLFRILTGIAQPDTASLTPLPVLTGTAIKESGVLSSENPFFERRSVSTIQDVILTEYAFRSRRVPLEETGQRMRLSVFLFPRNQLAAVRTAVSVQSDARDGIARELRELYKDIDMQREVLDAAELRLSQARNENQRQAAQAAINAARQAIDALRDRIVTKQADLDRADEDLLAALALVAPPAFDSDDASIPIVPIRIEEAFETDNRFNRVPRTQQREHMERLYIAVEASGMFELTLRGDFARCCDSAGNEFRWRVRDRGRVIATGPCARDSNEVPVAFAPSGNARVYTVDLGVDINEDGELQNSEIASKTLGDSPNPLTVLGVTQADYDQARDGLRSFATLANLGGFRFSSRLLFRFLDDLASYTGGITPSFVGDGTVQALDDRLTHAVGAVFGILNNVKVEHYNDGTPPSDAVEQSLGLSNTIQGILNSRTLEIQQFFNANPGTNEKTFDFPIPSGTPINLEADGPNLSVSIGHAEVEGTLQVAVSRDPNGKLESASVGIQAVLKDIYDFDYEAAFPAPLAATLQIGFSPGIGRRAGEIFLDEVALKRTYTDFKHKFN